MSGLPTLRDTHYKMWELSRRIDEGVAEVARQAVAHAEAELKYREAQAKAWLVAEGTVADKEAFVMGECARLRYERDIAAGMERAAIKALAARQTQLSSLQTFTRSLQAELDHSTYGPGVSP